MRVYLGYFFIIVAAICWGILGVFGRIAMSHGLGPLEVAFWRALLAGIFFLSHAIFIKDARIHSISDFIAFSLFGIFSIATFFASGQYAIKEGGVALASVLLYTAPAWVALFSRLFFKIPLTKITFIAIIIALFGVACISFSSGNGEINVNMGGIFFGLLSGFLYATHYVVTKKYLVVYTPFTLYGYASIMAALSLLPFINLNFNLPLAAWLSLVGIAFISTYIAYWFYCEAMKLLQATKVSIIANLEPVVAVVAAWLIWNESFSLFGWFGAILILCTVFILLFDDTKRNKAT